MKTSDRGVALIKQHEGLRLTAYPDAGYGWSRATIGYGHTSAAGPPNVTQGMRITEPEAEAILRADLHKFEGYVTDAVKVPLSQNEFDALVSFCFNLGPANLGSSTLLRKLNAGDRAGAAAEFPRWNKSNGKVLAGLTKRRESERALFVAPVQPSPAARPAPTAATSSESNPPRIVVGLIFAIVVAAIAIAIGG